MNKGIGFRRNIYLSWLDAAAALCTETDDRQTIRARLDPVIAEQVANADNRREALDIVINIWVKTADLYPQLRADAVAFFARSEVVADRLWLHYGLTLLYYDFFRRGVVAIGQLSRFADTLTPRDVKARLTAELGAIGALDKATERVIFSLRNWGILGESGQRSVYVPQRQQFAASQPALEAWLLAAALTAHPAEELPFPDLVRLPELFPFRFSLGVDALRAWPGFAVHRQGLGWDMVGLAPASHGGGPGK